MKKISCLVFVGLFMLTTLAVAQNEATVNQEMKGPTKKDGWRQRRMNKDKMGHGMMGAMGTCQMMKAGGEPQMVAVGDGVIILIGNKLVKYDKNLNVVKEVEIKIDMDSMKKMMMESGGCPMMGHRGEKGEPMGEEKAEAIE